MSTLAKQSTSQNKNWIINSHIDTVYGLQLQSGQENVTHTVDMWIHTPENVDFNILMQSFVL